MSGIVFFTSARREAVVEYYQQAIGATVWLHQPGCTIVQLDNQLLGFCDGDDPDTDGIITVVEDDRDGVDAAYERIADETDDPPSETDRYRIYHFYTTDPEGRAVEVQTFLHETDPITW